MMNNMMINNNRNDNGNYAATASGSGAGGYNPDYFEYDDELPEGEVGERIILSNDPIPVEIGVVKTIGTRKVNAGFGRNAAGNGADYCDWEDDEDDARIEEFLSS